MLPKNCGQLLYNAVRETLETMAFAEVIPCSIKVGNEEFAQDDDFAVSSDANRASSSGVTGWGEDSSASTDLDSWGTVVPETTSEDGNDDAWGTAAPTEVNEISEPLTDNSWAEPALPTIDDEENNACWGSGIIRPNEVDPWGDSDAMIINQMEKTATNPKEADFDNLVVSQSDWCWACMKVNSPDIHSVWFIVSKSLANALAQNMYAGEEFQLDNPLIRDLIAELTNVLGGRLMLLLEELGGTFTLTVPEIGFGLPDVPEQGYETAICKIVVDGEHPIIVALCFNQGGMLSPESTA
jgi:CheY-specific phosphatase CheX